MTNEEMLREIAAPPVEARNEIEDFVAFLRERYKRTPSSSDSAVTDLESEEFVGMWVDRDEMTDSTAWVRGIRDKHWAN